jgi:SAM-dependent methyltransferase
MASDVCACCGAALRWQGDYARCGSCDLWQSRLQPQILDEATWRKLDESARGDALKTLRQSNFRLLLERLGAVQGRVRGRLLDIGCAHGWFVTQAVQAGHEAEGLEPDPRLAAFARAECASSAANATPAATIREGFFPQALPPDAHFDVLVFNDVFEHLPDPNAALQACARHLRNGGLLVLNLPLASGFFFRLSHLLHKLGINGPWKRMWQAGFPSPHLFFYQSRHLVRLATVAGFTLASESALPTMSTRGLWARLRMDAAQPLWLHALQWPVLMLLIPVMRLLPNDIGLLIFRKGPATEVTT